MKIEDPQALAALCDILRAKGVTEFSVGAISVKLGSLTSSEPKKLETTKETCRCGHEIYMHNEHGECIGGCSNEACAKA